MQNKKNCKIQLFFEKNEINGVIDFEMITPGNMYGNDNTYIFETDLEVGTNTYLQIKIKSRQGYQSHIRITKIICNGVELKNWNCCCSYILADGKAVPPTYGYIDRPGTYTFKIRQNAIVHNYISYFYELCKK